MVSNFALRADLFLRQPSAAELARQQMSGLGRKGGPDQWRRDVFKSRTDEQICTFLNV